MKNAQALTEANEIDPFYFGSPGRTRDQLVSDPVCVFWFERSALRGLTVADRPQR